MQVNQQYHDRMVLGQVADRANWAPTPINPQLAPYGPGPTIMHGYLDAESRAKMMGIQFDTMRPPQYPEHTHAPPPHMLHQQHQQQHQQHQQPQQPQQQQHQAPPPHHQLAGTKRKSDSAPEEEEISLDDIDCGGMMMANCDQVRSQIRRFLDSGGMKVGEFCKAIGASNRSLNDFLRQTGAMKGSGNASYRGAWEFFKKRELAGIKMPSKKLKMGSTHSSRQQAAAAKKVKENVNSAGVDISNIHLPGEESDQVPVYETCDELRRKINAFLRKPNVTQAQFCRDMHAQLKAPDAPKHIQPAQLTRFRGNSGAHGGGTSSVYYAAYVFFEKVRIAEGKPKSKHRTEMEKIWPNGTDRSHGNNTKYWCKGDEQPFEDEYGRVSFR